MEMKMYLGEVEGDNSLETKLLSSAIEYESCGSYYYYWSSHCIDCSRYSSFHDVSGGNGNENVSW